MKERSIAVSIILTIITCGIYGIYWFICLTNEVKSASEDQELSSGALAFIFTLITCGIYGIYWAYKMGKLTATAQGKHGIPVSDNSVLYLLLQFFGLGIINYALIQNDLNAIYRNQGSNA